jgi:hypothetical protein
MRQFYHRFNYQRQNEIRQNLQTLGLSGTGDNSNFQDSPKCLVELTPSRSLKKIKIIITQGSSRCEKTKLICLINDSLLRVSISRKIKLLWVGSRPSQVTSRFLKYCRRRHQRPLDTQVTVTMKLMSTGGQEVMDLSHTKVEVYMVVGM